MSLNNIRQELLASGVLADESRRLVFKEDHTFKSPSGAVTAILGRNANGWKEWTNRFDGTLSELRRQVEEDTASASTAEGV